MIKKTFFVMTILVLCIGISSFAQNLCFNGTDIPDFGKLYDIELDIVKSGGDLYYYTIDNRKGTSKDYTVKEYCEYLEENGFLQESETDESRTYYRHDGSWIEIYSWKSEKRIFAVSQDKDYLLRITAKYDALYDTDDEVMLCKADNFGNTINLSVSKKKIYRSDIFDIFAACDTNSGLYWSVSDDKVLNLVPKDGKCTVTSNKTGRVTVTVRNAYGGISKCVIIVEGDFEDSVDNSFKEDETYDIFKDLIIDIKKLLKKYYEQF